MKNRAMIVLGCVCFFLLTVSTAKAGDVDAPVMQINNQLVGYGAVTTEEAIAIKPALADMIRRGASNNEIRGAIMEISKSGVKGKDLVTSVNALRNLVKSGENISTAGQIVSQGAREAQEQGLTGGRFAGHIQQSIREHHTGQISTEKADQVSAQNAKAAAREAKKAENDRIKAEKASEKETKKAEKEKAKADKRSAQQAKKAEQERLKNEKASAKKAEQEKMKADKAAQTEAKKAQQEKLKADKVAEKEAKKAEQEKIKAQKAAEKEAKKAQQKK